MVSIIRDERISVSEMIREYDNSNTGRIYTSALLKFFEFIYPALKDEIHAKKRELDARYIPPEVKMGELFGQIRID